MKAWYFSHNNRRLGYDDGRLIKAGITHKNPFRNGKVVTEPVLCRCGFHGSTNPIDALYYASGTYAWRVELGGKIVCGDDKAVATERTYLWGYDATEVLKRFARLCALDVIHLWEAPEIVIRFLKTGDPALAEAARTAAFEVGEVTRAEGDEWNAIWATWEATWVTRDATWVARDATWESGAAWDVVEKKQNKRLSRMLMEGRNSDQ